MTTAQDTAKSHKTDAHMRVPFQELREQGSYICNETGNLFRVPDESLVHGRSPLIEIVSERPTLMTKVSDDPWIPISKARQLAADADLYVNF